MVKNLHHMLICSFALKLDPPAYCLYFGRNFLLRTPIDARFLPKCNQLRALQLLSLDNFSNSLHISIRIGQNKDLAHGNACLQSKNFLVWFQRVTICLGLVYQLLVDTYIHSIHSWPRDQLQIVFLSSIQLQIHLQQLTLAILTIAHF